jgi:peptide methionine sulfoxide reductase msrA/msrB
LSIAFGINDLRQTLNPVTRNFSALIVALALLAAGNICRAGEGTPAATKTAIFAGGCFWCIQTPFDKAKGVVKTIVGYTGGTAEDATYEKVSSHHTKHREALEITYDPAQISYDQLLDIFWRNIDPTQADGQFYDVGPNYVAAVYYGNNDEKKTAEASKEKLAKSGKFSKPIVTEILPAMTFYPAEDYHQKYYLKQPAEYERYHTGSGRDKFFEKTWRDEKKK